jgi:hypothetical protein
MRRLAQARNPYSGVSLKCKDKDQPTRILFFNQTNLPVSPPFLEFVFASDGSCSIIINLEPHEFVDAVSRRKTIDGLCSMFVAAPHDVLRHAEIERAVLPAREEIDVVRHLEYRGYGFRARSLSAKSTQKASILSPARAPE